MLLDDPLLRGHAGERFGYILLDHVELHSEGFVIAVFVEGLRSE